ncbi:MAG: bifunctional [glutamate--ammonia ligase]-adenylyl-L-tyrosine phosphorylase/[glutamate--ammonia-ligase] adenylyltransferase [Thermoguttaceae bacterium]
MSEPTYEVTDDWLGLFGLVDAARGYRNLVSILSRFPTEEVRVWWCEVLPPMIRWTADPDMVLNNLERFLSQPSSESLFPLLNSQSLATLLEIFSTSQYLSDILIRDPYLFKGVCQNEGRPLPRTRVIDEILAELAPLQDDRDILNTIRRFKHRHTLRVAYGDIIRRQSLEVVTEQISDIADACVEGALRVAGRRLFVRRGTPHTSNYQAVHFTVLALGKLGGRELNYSSDIDLMFLYDAEGATDTAIPNSQYFAELGREIVRLLSDVSEWGFAYRVDMRLRPNGHHAPLAIGFDEAINYYASRGRTWERQAFLKARPIAGNIALGRQFLEQLQYWIYQPYLGQMDIAGIRSLKRKIERQAEESGESGHNVKVGHGGIRDIEFATQFLQLLNGFALPTIRSRNTLDAILRLERAGCLSHQESTILSEGYKFLRKVEHRIQMMFDLQTHTLPTQSDELRKLAFRMGYARSTGADPLAEFERDYHRKTELHRRILDHLFHGAFRRDQQTAAEVDLIFDPEPSPELIAKVLSAYRFRDVQQAYHHLMVLAEERVRYLSSRRSRHFLASIAPSLLTAVAATPDPDQTLATLANVSDALGGKAGLWELFRFHPPSLRLYVRLCALAPYLTDMLQRDPGMLDGLMDSLIREQLPQREQLDAHLNYLVAGAGDIAPILHGFKHDSILCVGVRDVIGKSDVRESTAVLSDIAQVCLKQIVMTEYYALRSRYGEPSIGRQPCRFAIVALGKFGGGEINYHSDLDLLFLYEGEGETVLPPVQKSFFAPDDALISREPTENRHFFDTLVQRVLKRAASTSAMGKLYEIDMRLRPRGRQGSLAIPLDDFTSYFTRGEGELWERLMLCRARVVLTLDESESRLGTVADPQQHFLCPSSMRTMTLHAVHQAQYAREWQSNNVSEIAEMRQRLQDANPNDRIKRGPGGLLDVEFLVQMLQLRYGAKRVGIRHANTLSALEKLYAAGILSANDRDTLRLHYRFLRTLESALRLLNCESTSTLPPVSSGVTAQLAMLVGVDSGDELELRVTQATHAIRQIFQRFFGEA